MNSNSAKIAKNTLLLYLRQILLILTSLYTVRIKLEILGVEDFGIYNIACGVVVIFTFLNTAMTNSTQRFINFAMGQNNMEEIQNVYSISIIIHFIISLIFIIITETIGVWFFFNFLKIPNTRISAAFYVYQLSIVSTVIYILRVPYQALIVSYEKFNFFSLITIIEILSRLGIVFILPLLSFDRLIFYTILILFTDIVIFFIYKFYCNKSFIVAHFIFNKNRNLYKKMIDFSWWNLFGNIADICCSKGRDILINIFYGVILNASIGIASQVNSTVHTFVLNFQTAFTPQIIKSYASNNKEYFNKLIFQTSKLSFYLLYFIILPLYINAHFVLKIWLKNVPNYTVEFMRLMLLYSLIDSFSGPLISSIRATGNIKKYQLFSSFLIFLNLPISYIFLYMKFSPSSVIIVRIVICFLIIIFQLIFLNRKIEFNIINFVKSIIFPIIIIVLISSIITYYSSMLYADWKGLIFTCFISSIIILLLTFFIGLNLNEKKSLIIFVKHKLLKFKKNNFKMDNYV